MAKASGGTRTTSSYKWSGGDSFEDVLHDAQQIFKKEATAGLGDFQKRKPRYVSSEEYNDLLKSGDYVEVYHGGKNHDLEALNGKYYINNDLHVNGFGYYFAKNESNAASYSNGGSVISALVKKSDIMSRDLPNLRQMRIEGAEKYIGKNALYKNGKMVTNGDKKDLYNTSTVAARNGYKVSESGSSSFIVIDRSALIMRKK